MGEHKSKHKDPDRKRKHKEDSEGKHKKKRKADDKVQIVDEDDEDMWVEKNIDMSGKTLLATNIPTAASLRLTSTSVSNESELPSPAQTATTSGLRRDEWMLDPSLSTPLSQAPRRIQVSVGDESLTEGHGEPSESGRTTSGRVDFFSSLGTEMRKRPDKPVLEQPTVSSKELNADIRAGKITDFEPTAPAIVEKITPGGPGSSWRMMRLRRVYETADEEGRSIEELAIERFGSLEAFEDAKEERRILDERGDRSQGRGRGRESQGEKGFMFNGSGVSSRSSSFRRPGSRGDQPPSTPSPSGRAPVKRRFDSLRLPSQAGSPLQQSHTPIPTVMTPPSTSSKGRGISPPSLNKLQAKVLRAKLMGLPNAEELEKEYEAASRSTHGGDKYVRTRVEVLPTLDGQGRLYDVGRGGDDEVIRPGNRRKKEEKFETHDPKTGDIIRYNADDDTTTLGEMLRHEKFGGGMADQKDIDAQYAKALMADGKFQNDLDYMDDNAEKLGRQKMRSDAMKRQFAIHDYKKTRQVLSACHFCFGEDDSIPKAPIIAMGTRVYLSCTTNEELVPGHCLIVPIQHQLNMLEGDDDVWDEVQNFMKSLMRMFAEDDKGVVFYETVINLRWQKHTYIECVPLPWEQFDLIPGYFKESILAAEAEWSQHKKLIDFAARPGGFRRAMVSNLPYFMIQFDYKGEKGYGHVIEGTGDLGDEEGGNEGEKGGGEFPSYFAGEIIGNIVELEPRKWRRPKRIDFRSNKERTEDFKKRYDKFDWTGMLRRS